MPAIPRALRGPLAAAALAPLLVAACQPVHPGSAALVGQRAVSVDTLQRLTNRVLAAADAQTKPQIAGDPAALARLQRAILTRLIDGDLLAAAAARLNVAVSEGEIDQEQADLSRQAGGDQQLLQQAVLSGIAPSDLRPALRSLALGSKISQAVVANETVSDAQLQAAYEQNIDQFDQVHAAHILLPTKAQADTVLARARANPDSFAALAQQFSQDTTTRTNGGDLGLVGKSRLDPTFAKAVFAAKPGSIIEVQSSFGWHVVHVIEHPQTSLAEATPQLRTSLLQSLAQQRVTVLLNEIARGLHISVSPRYGVWSLKDRAVNEAPNDLSKPAAKPTPTPTLPTGAQPQPPPSGG